MVGHHLSVERANAIADKLIEWRRTFHRFPELSFQEFETSRYIAKRLQKIAGINVEIGLGVETSVVGTLTSGDGPTIAIRADIDALPIDEQSECDYRSQNPGIMHACGHDAHAAILLGAAEILAKQFKEMDIQGTVKFIFQPAEESIDEEGMSGSPYLVQAGVYDGVDAAIALHMCPWLPVGEVQINDGYSMANVDVFQARIIGTGGHGAYPELGTDPTWMLGPVLQALHGIVSRKVPALEAAVISIGQIHAGTASNIIPTEVKIEGTIRSYSSEIRDLLSNEIQKAFSVVDRLDGEYSLEIQRGEPALVNHPSINDIFLKTIYEIYPNLGITKKPFGMGGEDFGYVTQILPGSMFFLGCAVADGVQRDLHTPIFDIDEKCLPIGAAILAQTARNFLIGEMSSTILPNKQVIQKSEV
ncbi:N-acetyl-L,L-diaminopimelate deacetylase [Planococcus halocryophilus Or1]|uniref:Peptidase M20 n=1 Tax=Planococcus halocryophilus TaxID=1215089 RepID=A0A1C7DVV7_9BACL|nr:M20 family metallopeptidase [Planococcus halocryophilus]ANU15391.1 peptidase M20 [Planococcus halocryophilus]EMF47755.1 N-acetyl-L,L-diaminopimelate deacetylase [Planococcus halocryophilus Or1]